MRQNESLFIIEWYYLLRRTYYVSIFIFFVLNLKVTKKQLNLDKRRWRYFFNLISDRSVYAIKSADPKHFNNISVVIMITDDK